MIIKIIGIIMIVLNSTLYFLGMNSLGKIEDNMQRNSMKILIWIMGINVIGGILMVVR